MLIFRMRLAVGGKAAESSATDYVTDLTDVWNKINRFGR